MAGKKESLVKKPKKRNWFLGTFVHGDIFSKLSYLIMGISNVRGGQIVKGLMYLFFEVCYIIYMAKVGFRDLLQLRTLGTKEQGMAFNEAIGIYEMQLGDNSMLILLYGVVAIVITAMFLWLYLASIRSGEEVRQYLIKGKKVPSFIDDIKSLFNENIHKLFLTIPILGIVIFTVMPLIFMILMAFTNYDFQHQPPGNLFHWVNLENFRTIFFAADSLAPTFWPILGWTLIWGFTATFSCYFGGMLLAILINSKGIKGKKIWRTIFITTMAIPSFISLMVVKTMLGENGIFNVLLQSLGFTESALPFLTNGVWAKWTCIIVNLWIGIPVTMLMTTGILMNIPQDLYDSAKIDGAGKFKMFKKITLPYMWFITTPYLISNLIMNFNNFGAIYFLTGGEPQTLEYFKGAGKTDLLVTWLYKLTRDSNDFNYAATIGIVIFAICATFSLIVYNRSKAFKDEEGFQ